MTLFAWHSIAIRGYFKANSLFLIQLSLLLTAVGLLYGGFLWNPLVFDDIYFFLDSTAAKNFGHSFLPFELRWLPYATLSWTVDWLGFDLSWLRIGNLLLHAINVALIFVLFRALFSRVRLQEGALSASWLAFFGALFFSWHPVAVYGAGYLIQRTTLLSTMFVLLMLLAYWRGVEFGRLRWLVVAAGCYFLAVFSKQHSLMAPAVALALTPLIRKPSWELIKSLAPFYLACAAIGIGVVLKSWGILGTAYELSARDLIGRLAEMQGGQDLPHTHLLSMLTQATLFFKYWLLWLLPNPAWMSVDMREPFADTLLDWPRLAGMLLFLVYPLLAGWLLLQRGVKGLTGFALMFPWLLFMTEFSVVRIQEPFVLYRSYLWMSVGVMLLPLMFIRVSARFGAVCLTAICLLMVPLSWDRLITFSHPLLLWDDAAKLIEGVPEQPGMERLYHNRATALSRTTLKEEAIADYTTAIRMKPDYSYAYNDRGAMYFALKRYAEALKDFDTAITLNPTYANAYEGRGMVHEVFGNQTLAQESFYLSCRLGQRSCGKLAEPMKRKLQEELGRRP